MSKTPQKINPVMVDWIDSIGQSGWGSYDHVTDMRCTSVGHLIKRDKNGIVLALNKSAYNHGDYITIPAVAIKKVRRLK